VASVRLRSGRGGEEERLADHLRARVAARFAEQVIADAFALADDAAEDTAYFHTHRSRDLQRLPEHVRDAAHVLRNGEVMWRDTDAAAAVEALADAEHVVLGLDVRFYDPDERFVEVAWSVYRLDPTRSHDKNVEAARVAALDKIERIDELALPEPGESRFVLVTWDLHPSERSE